MKRCGWLARWWHGRMRRLDVQLLWPAIEEGARRRAETLTELGELIRTVWDAHLSMPGQEHWHCECAGRDLIEQPSDLLALWRNKEPKA